MVFDYAAPARICGTKPQPLRYYEKPENGSLSLIAGRGMIKICLWITK
jgi:hypothetical protein